MCQERKIIERYIGLTLKEIARPWFKLHLPNEKYTEYKMQTCIFSSSKIQVTFVTVTQTPKQKYTLPIKIKEV